jgi:hypothetical protein
MDTYCAGRGFCFQSCGELLCHGHMLQEGNASAYTVIATLQSSNHHPGPIKRLNRVPVSFTTSKATILFLATSTQYDNDYNEAAVWSSSRIGVTDESLSHQSSLESRCLEFLYHVFLFVPYPFGHVDVGNRREREKERERKKEKKQHRLSRCRNMIWGWWWISSPSASIVRSKEPSGKRIERHCRNPRST